MFGDNIFGDNVDPHPPFDPSHLDTVLRKVKVRGRRRRLLVSAPFVLALGSGLAFFLANNSFGNSQVTQVGAALALEPGMSSASVSDSGIDSSESALLGDNGSVGDSYTSAPFLEVTPVPTLSTNSLDAEQPPIGFEETFARVLAGITPTPVPDTTDSQDLPASTPPPPASTPDHSTADQSTRVSTAAASEGPPETEQSSETQSTDAESSTPATADEPAAEADGQAAAETEELSSDADPSSAPTSTADTETTADLKSDTDSVAAVEESSGDTPTTEAASPAETSDGSDPAIDPADGDADPDPVAVTTETTAAADDEAADGGPSDSDDGDAGDSDDGSAGDSDDGTNQVDDEGDGDVVFIDADGNEVTPTPTPIADTADEVVEVPEPQPVVLEVAATVEGFSITIDIGVIDGDGYSIGACGTTVNWGDGSSHLSTCDPSCVPVDSALPGGGVEGQLSFSHEYEVSGVQVAPYITVFTGLECYGDSSTITFGPLVITEDGIVQS